MKKILIIMLVLLVAASMAYAAEDVRNTRHNLGNTGNLSPYIATNEGAVCVFCHTPHFATTSGGPLWNRTLGNSSGYNMYDSTFSTTIDMTVASGPQGVSLACLSCHDGTIAFDSLLNKPGSGLGAPTLTWNNAGNIMNATTSPAAFIGTDLRNDHPISITYDTSQDAAFKTPSNGNIGSLPLYGTAGNQVECGSCHNPHEKDNTMFLRVLNTGSALCLTCHTK